MVSHYLSSNYSSNNLSALQDNIALIAVLEAKFGNHGTENPSKRQLLCVVSASLLLGLALSIISLLLLKTIKNFHESDYLSPKPSESR